MNATTDPTKTPQPASGKVIRSTLLDVVNAVAEASCTEAEVVAVIHHLFSTGRMRLVGQFTEKDFATPIV